jgi:hypothetical protein
MLKSRDRVDGATVAPATPMRARAAMSISALVANAAIIDVTLNPTAPISRSFRRPIRSPSVPMVMSDPATRKP